MGTLKIISSSFAAAVLASFAALFVGMCVFGFRFAEWAEWQGRIVGLLATIAGIVGAVIGLGLALRIERRKQKTNQ
jgi:membrane protein DedA with SNARE-associated domain